MELYYLTGLFLIIILLYLLAKKYDFVKQLFSKITITFLVVYLI
ncbi:hypothetical protein ACRE4W_002148 [Enterococcus hirae]